jgi:hypothetical protein
LVLDQETQGVLNLGVLGTFFRVGILLFLVRLDPALERPGQTTAGPSRRIEIFAGLQNGLILREQQQVDLLVTLALVLALILTLALRRLLCPLNLECLRYTLEDRAFAFTHAFAAKPQETAFLGCVGGALANVHEKLAE